MLFSYTTQAVQLTCNDNAVRDIFEESAHTCNNSLSSPPPISDDTVPQCKPSSPTSREVDFLTQGIYRSMPGSWERKECWRNKRRERPRFISSRIYPGSERKIFKPRFEKRLEMGEGVSTAREVTLHLSKGTLNAMATQNDHSLNLTFSKDRESLFRCFLPNSKTRKDWQLNKKKVKIKSFQGSETLSSNNLIDLRRTIKLNNNIYTTWNACLKEVNAYKSAPRASDLDLMKVCETC